MAPAIAAASVLAKVTRDRIMAGCTSAGRRTTSLGHKGYVTPEHSAALDEHGPCPEHRFSYVNVARRVPGDQRVPARTWCASTTVRPTSLGLWSLTVVELVSEEVLTG